MIGEQKLFLHESCGRPQDCVFPELRARSRQVVTVIGLVDPATYDVAETGVMYVVRFEDGYEAQVFQDELNGVVVR